MNAHEDEEFTAHLGNAVKEAERLKYYPNYFKRDLAADGGFRTVKRILASGKPSEGFRKLWELGRLDLSCEAIIVETRWRKYFDEDLLERAERLLSQMKYPFRRFDASTMDLAPGSNEEVGVVEPRNSQSDSGGIDGDSMDSSGSSISPTTAPLDRWSGSSAELRRDIAEIEARDIPETTRLTLINARLGQGQFRQDLIRRWDGACAVTGCSVTAVLRASHCKPWRLSNDRERLDSNNGLLLAANLDALFDAGLVAFDDEGGMIVASALSTAERKGLAVPARLRCSPNRQLAAFLEFHREHVFVE
ncbi:HNH endonuclease [Dokdonella sp.]|uniref:HNH endonuclease n=1 Tax=Dokdonella sp. TaxID=2291710 RepID=UPI0037833BDE